MNKKQLLSSVVVFTFLFSSVLLFQNCSNENAPQENAYVNSLVPIELCGKEGFAYLHKNYFVPECQSCHNGLFEPRFANPQDMNSSFIASALMPTDKFRKSVLDNGFCGAACSLSPEEPLYKSFNYWLNCRY